MTTIYLKDIGYIKPGQESGTRETIMANDGTKIPLKGVSISFARGMSFDNKPSPGTYEENRLNYVSVTNPIITISGTVSSKGDVSASTNTLKKINSGTPTLRDFEGTPTDDEINMLYILDKLTTTKGYKELYYQDNSNNNSLLYGLGVTDTFNSTYRHLHVMCKGIRITQKGTSDNITWTLTCEVTKGE